MLKVIGIAVVLAFASSLALGQEAADGPSVPDGTQAEQVAAVDPNAPLPTGDSVVAQCTTMAADLTLADPEAGPCVTAAQAYVTALIAAPPPLTAPAEGAASPRDAALNTLVAEIAALTQDNICDVRDDELAAAVEAAAAAAEAEDTRSNLLEIARTIREVCTDGTTAAIVDGSPAV